MLETLTLNEVWRYSTKKFRKKELNLNVFDFSKMFSEEEKELSEKELEEIRINSELGETPYLSKYDLEDQIAKEEELYEKMAGNYDYSEPINYEEYGERGELMKMIDEYEHIRDPYAHEIPEVINNAYLIRKKNRNSAVCVILDYERLAFIVDSVTEEEALLFIENVNNGNITKKNGELVTTKPNLITLDNTCEGLGIFPFMNGIPIDLKVVCYKPEEFGVESVKDRGEYIEFYRSAKDGITLISVYENCIDVYFLREHVAILIERVPKENAFTLRKKFKEYITSMASNGDNYSEFYVDCPCCWEKVRYISNTCPVCGFSQDRLAKSDSIHNEDMPF